MQTLPHGGGISVAVDLLVMTVRAGRLCIMLARRAQPPCAGQWALPGRFVGQYESAETAARLLLKEMLPVDAFFEQLYTFSAPRRDPRGRVVSVAYLAIVPWLRLENVLAGDCVLPRCFEVELEHGVLRLTGDNGEVLTGDSLAFDHGDIVRVGVERLRGKIDYSTIGFQFLEDKQSFSLSALMAVYEAVLAHSIDNSNFRRAILARYEEKGIIAQTDRAEKHRRGRPAALYRLLETEKEDADNG